MIQQFFKLAKKIVGHHALYFDKPNDKTQVCLSFGMEGMPMAANHRLRAPMNQS